MFKILLKRYMNEFDSGSSAGGGGNTNTPAAGSTTPAPGDTPAGTAPADGSANAGALTPEQQAAADTAKADADKAAADKVAADKAAKGSEGAPEKYEFTLPEGQTLNPGVQTQFEAAARELGLTQDAAQTLVATMAPAIASAQADAFKAVQTEWETTVKADKELGGDKFDANLATAKKALETYGTPELKTFLNETGLGNHPDMVRMMFKVGQTLKEDKPVMGNQGNAKARDHAKSLYPNSN